MGFTFAWHETVSRLPSLTAADLQGPLPKRASRYLKVGLPPLPLARHRAAGSSKQAASLPPAALNTWKDAPSETGSMPVPGVVSTAASFETKTIFRFVALGLSTMTSFWPLTRSGARVVLVVDEPGALVEVVELEVVVVGAGSRSKRPTAASFPEAT